MACWSEQCYILEQRVKDSIWVVQVASSVIVRLCPEESIKSVFRSKGLEPKADETESEAEPEEQDEQEEEQEEPASSRHLFRIAQRASCQNLICSALWLT